MNDSFGFEEPIIMTEDTKNRPPEKNLTSKVASIPRKKRLSQPGWTAWSKET